MLACSRRDVFGDSRYMRDTDADANGHCDEHAYTVPHPDADPDANARSKRLLPNWAVLVWSCDRWNLSGRRAGLQCELLWRNGPVRSLHAEPNKYSNANPHADSNRNSYTDRNSNLDANCDANCDANEYTDAYVNANSHPDSDTNADARRQ
jgi:hypothetical protein